MSLGPAGYAGDLIGAVDIGGTKIAVGMVDAHGRIAARTESPTASQRGFADGLSRIVSMLRETAARAGQPIEGIGIGSTGPVDPFTGVMGSVDLLPGWQGWPIVDELAQAFHVSVAMENDADAGALAESAWGAGQGSSHFVYVTVGTGIGVSVVLDGAIYRGVGGAHPEIGHQVIDASGPECYCGAHGCWEIMAAGPALLAWANHRLAAEQPQTGPVTMPQLCAMAQAGDATAMAAMQREGYYLGLGLANLVNTFCPEVIALSGGVLDSSHLFLYRAHEVIRQCCKMVPYERTAVRRAALGPDANLIGAAQVWHFRCGSRSLAHEN